MAWFEAHDTLGKHPKTLALARLLKVRRREAVGLLHDLFAWGLSAADKHGLLKNLTAEDIGEALDFAPKKGRDVVAALVEAGFLDCDDESYYIHDWYDYAGKLYDARERNRKKVRAFRDRRKQQDSGEENDTEGGNSNGNVTVTQPLRNGVTVPNRTVPNNNLVTTACDEAQSEAKPKRQQKVFDHDSEAYKCAAFLEREIQKRLPARKPSSEATLQRWADAFDKTHRIDGYSWELIAEVLEFSQDDPFWQKNILSGGTFREQFVKLYAKMGGK